MSDHDMSQTDETDGDMHPVSKMIFGWVEHPKAGQMIFWAIAALAVILIMIDPLRDIAHAKEDIENIFGAYGWYGFMAFGFVVLTGWPLGALLRRGENYYGDQDETPDETDEVSS